MNKEEAIKIVKSHYPANKQMLNEALEFLIPELKESEDELTWLKNYISEEAYYLSMDIRDNEDRIKLKKLQKSLAWLKKQSKQKPVDENAHLWTIDDAKDGDVLISWTNKPFIYNGFFNESVVGAYCGLNTFNRIIITDKQDYLYYNWTIKKDVRPATQEQCDFLFKKMKESGYKWNADKKELKNLIKHL